MSGGASSELFSRVSVPGVTLANLLSTFAAAEGPVDGLLLGRHTLATTTQLHDEEVASHALTTHEKEAHIMGTHSSAGALTSGWYDAAGRVHEGRLGELAAQWPDDKIVGWFSARRHSAQEPSMRERAVTAGLASFLMGDRPVLFLLATARPEHDGATVDFSYTCFQYSARSEDMVPVELTVRNLAGGAAALRYMSVPPVPSVALDAATLAPSADAAMRSVKAMEGACNTLLERLEKDLSSLKDSEGRVLAARRELADLVQASRPT
ncbi:unnamed protein product [Pedinophyceae sp. YPF-701]|nr:unnamed protein product [Pedinophyceae sp. YPF-701]